MDISYQSRVPPVVLDYMTRLGLKGHPQIAQTFRPGIGWRRYPGHKFISASWAQKLRVGEGVTHLSLEVAPGRMADFSIAELLRRETWPVA